VFREFVRTIRYLWLGPRGRNLIYGVSTVFAIGTVFYKFVEDWSWVDALYYTTVTLTTVGYGDFVPTKDISKLFTIAFLIAGVGYILAFLNFLVTTTVERRQQAQSQGEEPGPATD
jgi:hypothetical protein